MTLNIPAMDGTVQVVLSVEHLERILEAFPRLDVFPIPYAEGGIPTYAFAPKPKDNRAR